MSSEPFPKLELYSEWRVRNFSGYHKDNYLTPEQCYTKESVQVFKQAIVQRLKKALEWEGLSETTREQEIVNLIGELERGE